MFCVGPLDLGRKGWIDEIVQGLWGWWTTGKDWCGRHMVDLGYATPPCQCVPD